MKVLHTSDLHLGKSLLEESLYDDQKDMLNKIIKIIKEREVEVLLISGDIYDKSIPSADATNLFNDFLINLSNLNVETLIISGNHDSKDRLAFGSSLFNKLNIHIETEYNGKLKKYSFDDKVNFYLLPFIKTFHLKKLLSEEEYSNITNSNEMMKYILSKETIDKKKKNILLAHQFVINKGENIEFSDSESSTNVGTLDAIDVNLLDDFDYVALGHIHKPQKIKKDTIRYSGTPLKYSFSEVNNKNHVVLIDTDNMELEFLEIKPLREMRVIKGKFEEILQMSPSNDLIRFELTNEDNLLSPMEELKKKFPNALSLSFIKNKMNDNDETIREFDTTMTPIDLFNNFFKMQNDRELDKEEINILENITDELGSDL